MLILNPAAMSRARSRGRCRWCGNPPDWLPIVAAHVWSRGCGGPEADWNLCGICSPCHAANHAGDHPTHDDLKLCAAADNDCLQSDIDEAKWCLDRLPGEPADYTDEQIKAALAGIPGAAARLVREAVAGHVAGRKLRKRKWPKLKRRSK